MPFSCFPHGLFFAKRSSSWGNGGIAFVTSKRDESMHTYGRMWKITEEQFSEIWKQEGPDWYNKKIDLGEMMKVFLFGPLQAKIN